MKLNRLFIVLLFPNLAYSAVDIQITPPIGFSGGVNLKDTPINIRDDQSPDMVNFVSDEQSSRVRNGTRKFHSNVLSTQPITGLHRAYSQTGKKLFFVTNRDTLYVSTQTDSNINSVWNSTYTGFIHDKRVRFVTFNNQVIAVQESTAPIVFDLVQATASILGGNPPQAKFILKSREQLLLANTTTFPNRIFYSELANSATWPINNTIDIETIDGTEITGMTNHQSGVYIYKTNSVWLLSYNILTSGTNGDQVLSQQSEEFGCIAPDSLVNFGDGDFFLARDGIRILVGGRSSIISRDIEPIINRILKDKTYSTCVSLYDKKNKWIWFSYNDVNKLPLNINNSVLIYDTRLNQWYPIEGIFANVFSIWDGAGDSNQLFYGDSLEGYVKEMDVENHFVDVQREIQILDFEVGGRNRFDLNSGGANTGFASINIGTRAFEGVSVASVTSPPNTLTPIIDKIMKNINVYPDGTPVELNDLLSFWVYRIGQESTTQSVFGIQLDSIDNAEYSVNVNFNTLPLNRWVNVTIALSSFGFASKNLLSIYPLKRISFGLSPGACSPTFIDATGANGGCVFYDNFRIVQSSQNVIKAYRDTKPFGSAYSNRWNSMNLNLEKSADTELKIFFTKDFGKKTLEKTLDSDYKKVIYISSENAILKFSKEHFNLIYTSASFGNTLDYLYVTPIRLYGVTTSTTIGAIYEMELESMTVIKKITTLPNGETFLNPISIATIDNEIFVCESGRNRILKFKDSLIFVSSFSVANTDNPGSLSFDGSSIYILDHNNHRIIRTDSNLNIKAEIGINNISSGSIWVSDKFLYAAIQSRVGRYDLFEGTKSVIQIRDKINLGLLKEILTEGNFRKGNAAKTNSSSNTVIAISGDSDFIYHLSTDAVNSRIILQQYSIDNLKFIRQNIGILTDGKAMTVSGYHTKNFLKNVPIGLEAKFLQIRYEVNKMNDRVKLFNQSFYVIPQELR